MFLRVISMSAYALLCFIFAPSAFAINSTENGLNEGSSSSEYEISSSSESEQSSSTESSESSEACEYDEDFWPWPIYEDTPGIGPVLVGGIEVVAAYCNNNEEWIVDLCKVGAEAAYQICYAMTGGDPITESENCHRPFRKCAADRNLQLEGCDLLCDIADELVNTCNDPDIRLRIIGPEEECPLDDSASSDDFDPFGEFE